MLSRVLLCRLLLFYGIGYYPGLHYHRPGYSPPTADALYPLKSSLELV